MSILHPAIRRLSGPGEPRRSHLDVFMQCQRRYVRKRTMATLRLVLASICTIGLLTSACSGGPTSTSPSDPTGSVNSPPVDRGPAPNPQPPPSSGKCDATKAQWAVGQRASLELLERARDAAQANVARFIRPNEPVTLEFSPARLNLGLDARDIVASVICG